MAARRRKIVLITVTAMAFTAFILCAIGAILTTRQHHDSLLSVSGYLQACLENQSPPLLSGAENVLRGVTTRSVSACSDGSYIVLHSWKVFGVITTRRRLYIKVSADPKDDPVLFSVSRDPI